MKDFRGIEIVAGCTVVYPYRVGTGRIRMEEAVVDEVVEGDKPSVKVTAKGRLITISSVDRVAVVQGGTDAEPTQPQAVAEAATDA